MIKKQKTTYEIDMLHGPLVGKILLYAAPLILSGVLQLAFNAVDLIVVGQFAGSNAMAAVGCTSSLINLIISLFIGISAGVNVLVARFYAADQKKDLKEVVHTAIALSVVGGVLLAGIGILIARPVLRKMGTPDELLDYAVTYMQIYFAGMPLIMLYNFGSAVLRGVGDSRRPLYYIATAGIVNVFLNIIFVKFFYLETAGVALGTVFSQLVSVILLLHTLITTDRPYKICVRELKFTGDKLAMMLRIGLPAGLQSCLFSLSNVIIQSSVNSFGSFAVSGNTAASNIEGFVYTAMNAFYQTALSFVGQNYGAGNMKRIKKISFICVGLVTVFGGVLGFAAVCLGKPLLALYGAGTQEIEYGLIRLSIICSLYFLCGIMDTLVGVLRGLGYAIMPMLVSLTGACLFRIVWVKTIFETHHSLRTLYISYPVSWLLTAGVHALCLVVVYHQLKKKHSDIV